jgi:alpha-glucosidase (family GH31 glycosyl hydrolase)
MRAFVDQLHADGLQWVPIHDAAIAKRGGYKAYEEGSRDDVWIKDMRGETYVGQVWPGEAVYPDYLAAANVSSWLQAQLQAFYDQAPFDGLWLDMNEASNFCSGVNCKPDTADKAKMMCEWPRAGVCAAQLVCVPVAVGAVRDEARRATDLCALCAAHVCTAVRGMRPDCLQLRVPLCRARGGDTPQL